MNEYADSYKKEWMKLQHAIITQPLSTLEY
jgi:hypothetical protein